MKPYKEFLLEFDNTPVYTKRQMAEALNEQEKRFVVNRVIQQGKDCDVALMIVAVNQTPEGLMVIVK